MNKRKKRKPVKRCPKWPCEFRGCSGRGTKIPTRCETVIRKGTGGRWEIK